MLAVKYVLTGYSSATKATWTLSAMPNYGNNSRAVIQMKPMKSLRKLIEKTFAFHANSQEYDEPFWVSTYPSSGAASPTWTKKVLLLLSPAVKPFVYKQTPPSGDQVGLECPIVSSYMDVLHKNASSVRTLTTRLGFQLLLSRVVLMSPWLYGWFNKQWLTYPPALAML